MATARSSWLLLPALAVLANGCQQAGSVEAPDVSPTEARAIAAGFVEAEARNRPEWQVGQIDDLVTYFDSAGEVQAYEVRVRDPDRQPAGWLVVEGWEEFGPVSAFATAGSTNFDRLVEQYHSQGGEAGTDAMVPLWGGPAALAMDVSESDGTVVRVSPSETIDTTYDGRRRRELQRGRPVDPDDVTPADQQRRALRALYAAGEYDSALMGATPTSIESRDAVASIAINGGAGAFAHYKWELRDWPSANSITYCKTGCAPVAFAIILEFWEHRGYPNLIGTVADTVHPNHTDTAVIAALRSLREAMSTQCSSNGGEGDTYTINVPQARAYINSRNEGLWTTDNDLAFHWDTLRSEINAGRPAILHYDVYEQNGGINHAAVAYEYTDNSGSSNDWICVEKGWYTSGITWQCVQPSNIGLWYQVTRVVPPSISPPTNVAASDNAYTDRVRVTWTATASGRYTLKRSLSPASYGDTIASNLSGTSYDDTTAAHGTTYYYWIRSETAGEISKFSRYDIGSRATQSTSVRVAVAGVSVTSAQFVCASAWGQSTRRATQVGGAMEVLFTVPSLPSAVDTVFWVSTSEACTGGWVRDIWPSSNTYTVNGTTVNRCVPRPDAPQWSYVRGTVNSNGTVGNTGSQDCPGGPGGNPSGTSARVAVAGISLASGQYVCASAWNQATRRANAVGDAHEATFTLSSAPADLDTVFWISMSSTCAGSWVRDLWPSSNAYSINGITVNRCVPRPDNAQWRYVRGTVFTNGTVGNTGALACP